MSTGRYAMFEQKLPIWCFDTGSWPTISPRHHKLYVAEYYPQMANLAVTRALHDCRKKRSARNEAELIVALPEYILDRLRRLLFEHILFKMLPSEASFLSYNVPGNRVACVIGNKL